MRVLTKQFKENWRASYDDRLERSERTHIRIFRKYYKDNYQKAIEKYEQGVIKPDLIMTTREMTDLYIQMYQDIGIKQAKWYANNFDKFIKKVLTQINFWIIGIKHLQKKVVKWQV